MSLHTFTHAHTHSRTQSHSIRFFVHIHEKLLAFIVVVVAAAVLSFVALEINWETTVPASVPGSASAPVSLATKKMRL